MQRILPEFPVAVGGVGGSGTRLIAELLQDLGYDLGSDLNDSRDNLWFTLLFKRIEILNCPEAELARCLRLFVGRMSGDASLVQADLALLHRLAERDRAQHDAIWLRQRVDTWQHKAAGADPAQHRPWGWKEPNTHILIDRLLPMQPALKYVHVIRSGLDMAFSDNRNQLRLWGPAVLGNDALAGVAPGDDAEARLALTYWCAVHRRMLDLRARCPARILLLNYDRLCTNPAEELPPLLAFLGADSDPATLARLTSLIRTPSSIGRFRGHDSALFDPDDIAFVASLGFPIWD